MQNQDDPRRWRVSYTGEVQRRLNVILEASMVRGKLSEYNSVIEDIHRRLLTDPEDFGEPRRYLPFLNLMNASASFGDSWFDMEFIEKLAVFLFSRWSNSHEGILCDYLIFVVHPFGIISGRFPHFTEPAAPDAPDQVIARHRLR